MQIQNIILNLLKEYGEELSNDTLKNANGETKIFGSGGNLDSLGLVNFVADLEELLSEKLEKQIVLADEKTMSAKNSPFKDVATLSRFIEEKIS